jgi:hypothetical protein
MSCDTLGGALPITSMQTNICTRSDECANNRKITTFGSNGQRRVKNIIITMNIRIRLRTEQCLHSFHIPASHVIHECSTSLC